MSKALMLSMSAKITKPIGEPLSVEQLQKLLAEGREARRVLEERVREMRTPTVEQMMARAR